MRAGVPSHEARISSGPFEISPASFGTPSDDVVPPTFHGSPVRRNEMPLSKIVGIGSAIFVVLVGLTLLLFR
jgi:hypothetical protein